jgi:hypothetical protein
MQKDFFGLAMFLCACLFAGLQPKRPGLLNNPFNRRHTVLFLEKVKLTRGLAGRQIWL